MKTFKCNFGKGVICTVRVPDECPPPGNKHIQTFEWQGRPSGNMYRHYVAWINSVNKLLADEWGATLMHCFFVSATRGEFWCYEPGCEPKCLGEQPLIDFPPDQECNHV